ncbi:MAG: HAD-IB family hydrolase [Planctomycetes bacterium]|nr:HAD-IB family hydrolase [Planctomycetota bacterium]
MTGSPSRSVPAPAAKTGAARAARSAAFFDVDGTIAKTTIVHYYIYFRRRIMQRWLGPLWNAAYFAKCGYYLLLDRVDRHRLNIVFYRDYRHLPVREIRALVADCHRDVIAPRCFPEALTCVREHQAAGRDVVLVTGSVDFIMQPLAEQLRARDVLAARLVEADGRFTGLLAGPPIAAEEKGRRVCEYAQSHGIDLASSYAYGDSVADLAMLEAVGRPQVVNPDRRLAAIARQRGWPVRLWRRRSAEGNGRC